MMKHGIFTFVLIFSGYFVSFCQVINNVPDSLPSLASLAVDLKPRPKVTSYIVPAVFIGYGLVTLTGDNAIRRLDYDTHAELKEDHPAFALKIDNYSRYIPGIAVYGLDLVGIKAKNNILDRSIMLLSSYALVAVGVSTMKGLSNRARPDGSNYHSFPSGHAALAFMTAEYLHQEYKDQSIWYSIGGYAIATSTGILRLYNNAHWVSDVVAGAGFGILSTKLTYLVYPYIKRKLFHGKPADLIISPGYQNGNMSFSLLKRLY